MAAKRKTKKKTETSSKGENYFTISTEKKKKIIGIFLIVFSILILLSIISYSRFDKANLNYSFGDFFRAFSSNSDFVQKAESTHNWLGIFGAYISDFFINSTVGIFSIVFPVMFFIWGYSFFQKINSRTIIHTSNFLIISAIILSTFFGVLRMHYNVFDGVMELSGSVGDYLGEVFSRILGGVGSLIFLFAAFIVLLIFAFDIKVEKIFEYLKLAFTSSVEKLKEASEENGKAEKETNLDKIKDLSEESPRKKKKKVKEKAKEKADR